MSPRTSAARSGGRAARLDQICASASALARDAIQADPSHIGDHVGTTTEGDRLVTHRFNCLLPGYRGWHWAVTVTRIARSRHVTVCETSLLPGRDALRAPEWVPWRDRLRPGDLGVGDLLPTSSDDDRLMPGYLLSDDEAVEEGLWERGLGRARVLSREGRAELAQRWYDGDHGPNAPISLASPAPARCGACGFYLPLAGSLRQLFGVCGNRFAPDDGRVVSVDHGCGANSEVVVDATVPVDELPTVYDDSEIETITVRDTMKRDGV
ncbi:MAG: DUF3027 domain-containing protein [Micromonosporaceae bacterium]|nr:DUF3027 domain-containing protein [Micromonosporaceae bacterium]